MCSGQVGVHPVLPNQMKACRNSERKRKIVSNSGSVPVNKLLLIQKSLSLFVQ